MAFQVDIVPQRRMFRPISGRLADKDRRARHGRENRVAQDGSRPVRTLVGFEFGVADIADRQRPAPFVDIDVAQVLLIGL